MRTSNDIIYDALVRQQVNLQRLSKGEAEKLVRMLDASDKELNSLINDRLAKILTPDFTTKRWMALESEISQLRGSVMEQIEGKIDQSMSGVAKFALDDTKSLVEAAVPVEINFAMPPIATVRELARSAPFGGADMMKSMGEWMKQLGDVDKGRIMGALKSGLMGGEDIARIASRVAKATGMTKQNAEAISRTAINHASNTARDELFKENSDVIEALRWTSTLDGRTSPICRARDGQFDSVEPNGDMEKVPKPHIEGSPRRPPAHLKCRSVMIAILDGDTLAGLERPFVADKRTRQQREKDFRVAAKEKAGDNWSKMSRKERETMIREERVDWTRTHVGTVPAEMTYDQWLRQQTPELQNDVLGKTKAQAFRNGATVQEFIDKDLNILTIDELYDTIPDKMPPRTPSAAGPGTPTATQITKEAKRREKLERDRADKAEREKRDAEKKAKEMERRAAAAERKAEQEAKAAARSDSAAEVAVKKQARAEAEAAALKEEAARRALVTDPDEKVRVSMTNYRRIKDEVEQKRDFKGNYTATQREIYNRMISIVPEGEDVEAYKNWIFSLSDDELQAFKNWTWEGNPRIIRDWQRGRSVSAQYREFAPANAKALEAALARAPKYEGIYYRGATTAYPANFRVGSIISDEALASNTFHPGVAAEFALKRAETYGKTPVIFKILDGGGQAVNIQHLTNPGLYFEGEIMTTSKVKYEIVELNEVKAEYMGLTYKVLEVVLRAIKG